MSGFANDLGALDGCRRAVLGQAGQFGGIADQFPGPGADATMFGKLPVSARLAALSRQVDAAAHTQFSAAESFLRAVERGLDTVRDGVEGAERSNIRRIQTV